MNRFIIRFAALLLIPCLLAGPITAAGFAELSRPVSAAAQIPSNAFQEEALTLALAWTARVYDSIGYASRRWAAGLRPSRAAVADGGRWPVAEPLYDALQSALARRGWRRLGWFMGRVAAPVLLESGLFV